MKKRKQETKLHRKKESFVAIHFLKRKEKAEKTKAHVNKTTVLNVDIAVLFRK